MSKDKPEQSAEEILKEHFKTMGADLPHDSHITFILFAMQEYAESYKDMCVKKACKEQRDKDIGIVNRQRFINGIKGLIGKKETVEAIKNAPSPD